MKLLDLLATDLRAKSQWCYGNTRWRDLLKTLLTDGSAAMIWYRLMQAAGRCRLVPLEMVCNKLNAICCNCIIGRGAEFGPGFVLIHSTGVVINGRVRGGSHVYLEHQVTIGAEQRLSPVLGDRVFIGAGAKIVGAVTIGDDCRIGANAVVVRDIPSGSTAVGIPARVVRMYGKPPSPQATNEEAQPLLVPASSELGCAPPSLDAHWHGFTADDHLGGSGLGLAGGRGVRLCDLPAPDLAAGAGAGPPASRAQAE